MTASSAPHFIKFVEALAAGKIVTKKDGDGVFKKHSEYAFDGNWEDYRIEEPEPVVEVEKTAGQVAHKAYWKEENRGDASWDIADQHGWEAAASAVIEWSRKQPASPWPAVVTIHNPDNLTPEKFGDPAIWRPATPDETADCEHERWDGSWGSATKANVPFILCARTYRIRRSVRDWPSAKVEVKEPTPDIPVGYHIATAHELECLPKGTMYWSAWQGAWSFSTRVGKDKTEVDRYICPNITPTPLGSIDIPPGSKLMHPNGDWFIPTLYMEGLYRDGPLFIKSASNFESEGWLIQRPGSDTFVPFKRGEVEA